MLLIWLGQVRTELLLELMVRSKQNKSQSTGRCIGCRYRCVALEYISALCIKPASREWRLSQCPWKTMLCLVMWEAFLSSGDVLGFFTQILVNIGARLEGTVSYTSCAVLPHTPGQLRADCVTTIFCSSWRHCASRPVVDIRTRRRPNTHSYHCTRWEIYPSAIPTSSRSCPCDSTQRSLPPAACSATTLTTDYVYGVLMRMAPSKGLRHL